MGSVTLSHMLAGQVSGLLAALLAICLRCLQLFKLRAVFEGLSKQERQHPGKICFMLVSLTLDIIAGIAGG
jgi:hypothetical protein